MTEEKNVIYPDFDLGPFIELPPEIFGLNQNDREMKKLHGFIITLALIFNDFKGLMWWNYRVKKCEPKSQDITPHMGQYNGMSLQIRRLLFGLFFELLQTIKVNNSVIQNSNFKMVLNVLPSSALDSWNDLVKASQGQIDDFKTDKDLFKLFQKIRSNGIFHYENVMAMMDGYDEFFSQKNKFSEFVRYSIGKNMERTRFYFADASYLGFESKLSEELKKSEFNGRQLGEVLNDFLQKINISLKFVVEIYLKKIKVDYERLQKNKI